MKIAIHHKKGSYSSNWIGYCVANGIEHKVVNCYDNDIVKQLGDCDALMWHHYHESAKDTQFAKQLLYALEGSGKLTFPDFSTNWHFDDKVGQKYLLEAIDAPIIPSYAIYIKKDAVEWANKTSFPKVFKLRGGSASKNVKLVKTRSHAIRLINKAFGRGYKRYDAWGSLKDRWRLFRLGKEKFYEVLKGVARFVWPTYYSRILGRDRGYVYFQEFIPENEYDIRVTYVNNRCFAFRRHVRPGDFRASGSYMMDHDQSGIPEQALRISFDVAHKLGLQTAAFDFVLKNEEPLIVELSYAFGLADEQFDHGYWDQDMNFHPDTFDAFEWMVEGVIEKLNKMAQ